MEWTVVKIEENSGKNVPFVSIGRGSLDFNAVACDLINDDGSYEYAQILQAKEKGKTVIAVKFLKEFVQDSIRIKRKMQNGKPIKGMSVVNKGVVSKLFGKDGNNEGKKRCGVELVDCNILKIID